MINITRSYPGVLALKNVSVAINKGKILGLVGENGAGKSTLMKILCGADQPDQGEILIEGEKVILSNPRTAREYGIFMVQQELSLIPPLRVVDNIVLGEESKKTYFNILRNKENLSKAKEALNIIGLNINPNQKVSELDIATQQMIEIARNLIQKPKVLILDEPTAALSVNETKRLLNILKNL
ncbi:MAG: sugar ABC transporter ATP-binding protein, partial [Candidatus Methanofastidiosa archaeon]|nr:sugar ABC transporter ATP-binding protein [Candidatus Methanofastidiosa archaeon]